MTYKILFNDDGNWISPPDLAYQDYDIESLGDAIHETLEWIIKDYCDCVDFTEYQNRIGVPLEDEIIICEVQDKIGGKETKLWIKEHIKTLKIQNNKEDYNLYLKLKAKYES